MPPVLVCAEDGQNGEWGPAPSSVIESGDGFGIVDAVFGQAESEGSRGDGERRQSDAPAGQQNREADDRQRHVRPEASDGRWSRLQRSGRRRGIRRESAARLSGFDAT